MSRTSRFVVALAATVALVHPFPAIAQHRGGGGGGGHAAPAPQHMSAPAAPRAAQAPTRPSAPAGGFDLHEDVAPVTRPAPQTHAAAPARPTAPVSHAANRPATGYTANRPAPPGHAAPSGHRPALIANLGYNGQAGNHRVIGDPRYHGGNWGWNHGETWNPAPHYWGGGFWGPWALGAATAALFGAIYYDDATLDSYEVEPDSPGAELLENYQLTQVPCGPPDLVVIFGPDNSVICADPNGDVAAGEYQLDPADLTIVSLG